MRTVEEPEGIAPLELQFPISRRFGTGTTGSIEVKIKIRQQMLVTGRNDRLQNNVLFLFNLFID